MSFLKHTGCDVSLHDVINVVQVYSDVNVCFYKILGRARQNSSEKNEFAHV